MIIIPVRNSSRGDFYQQINDDSNVRSVLRYDIYDIKVLVFDPAM